MQNPFSIESNKILQSHTLVKIMSLFPTYFILIPLFASNFEGGTSNEVITERLNR
jgi:hypothetical protein